MADLNELFSALQKADAAGNADDAKQIAGMIQQVGGFRTLEMPKPQGGIMGALKQGAETYGSQVKTGITGALSHEDANQAAIEGLQRQEEIGQKYEAGPSLDAITKAYKEKGLLSAAGEAISQVPKAIAGQGAQLGAMGVSSAIGSIIGGGLGTAVEPGVGTVVGAGLGAKLGATFGQALSEFPQFFGAHLERQAQEQIKSGQPVDVNRGKAALGAAGSTAIDVVEYQLLFGSKILSNALGMGEKSLAKMPTEAVEKIAQEKLLPMLLKGTAKGAAVELPSEITQQIIERAQAGLPLTSPDAINEYGSTAYQVALLGPLGIIGRSNARSEARTEASKRYGDIAAQQAIEAEQAKAAAPTPPDETGQTGLNLQGGVETAGPRQQLPVQQEQPFVGPEQQSPQMELDFEQPYPKSRLQAEPPIIGQEEAKPPQVSDLEWAKQRLQSGAPLTPTQQLLLQEDKAKQQTAFQNAPAPQLEIPNIVGAGSRPTSHIVDDNALSTFGFTKAATKIKNDLRGLDLMKPEDAAKFDDLTSKHERKNAKIDMQAVQDFKDATPEAIAPREVPERAGIPAKPYDARTAFQQGREAQFAFGQGPPVSPKDTRAQVKAQAEAQNVPGNGIGFVNGPDERSVQVPSTGVQTAGRPAASKPTRVGSAIGTTEQPNGRTAPSGKVGNVALTQMAQQVAPAEKPVVEREETKAEIPESVDELLARHEVPTEVSADTEELMRQLGIAKSIRDSILGRNTPELEAEVVDGNTKAALQELAKSNKFTELDNLLAQGLLDSNKTFPAIEIVPKGVIEDNASGQYNSRTDTVQIEEGQVDSHTILHEVAHGSLHSMIIADMQRVAEGKPANPMLKDLKDVYNHAVQARPDLVEADTYGMKNLSEFASEIWSNPKFQLEMANTPYKVMNILTAFGRKVVKLLTGIDLPSGKVGQVKANTLIAGLIAVQKAMPQGRNVQEVRGAQIGAGIAPIQVSTAPTGIPQKIWDLHEKHLVAQANARTWNYGAAKREMTMSFRRLNEAVKSYTNNDDAAGLKLMQQMNEESSRREEQEVPKVQRTPQGQDAESLMAEFGGRPQESQKGYIQKKVDNFNKAKDSWTEAYERNHDWVAATFGKGQNIASFDQAFNNRMYNHLMGEAKKGNMALQNAKTALLRISTSQALHRGNLANQIIERGDYYYDSINNRWEAVDSKDGVSMTKFEGLIKDVAKKLGIEPSRARQIMGAAYEANRLNSMYTSLSKTENEIALLEKEMIVLRRNKKRTKADKKVIALKEGRLKQLEETQEDLSNKVQHKTKAQVDAGMKLYNAHAEIAEGTKVWNKMRDLAVNMLVKTGVKSKDEAERWLDDAAYVPFFRDMDEEKAAGPNVMARGLRESMKDFAMKGSMRQVQDPIENMYQWMQWSMARAISNKQLQVMLEQYKSVLPEEVREGPSTPGNTFTIYYDGIQRKFSVADPAIAQAFVGLEPIVFHGIGVAVKATNALRHIVTRFPLFSAVQLFSDSYSAMYSSGLKSPFGVLKEIAKEVGKTAAGTSETREMLKRTGILETHDYTATREEDAIAKRLGLDNPSKWTKLMSNLDRLSSASDNVIRQGVYNQGIKEGLSHTDAMERATEIVNFRRISADPRLQFASRVIPFFNAYLQVNSVLIKTLTGRGVSPQERSAARAALISTTAKIAVLSFIYSAAVGDDEDYKRKNRISRDRMFMIPGSGGYGIPIRTDMFALPKIIGEYTYQMMGDHSTTDSKMLKQAIGHAVLGSFMPPSQGIPQIVRPGLEVATNHDFFQDREIVNATMRRLDTDRQFTKNTSEMAKALGQASGLSPLVVDHLLRGYFGTVMTLTALATNDLINAARGGPPRPDKSIGDMVAALPNMGSFVSKDENTAVLSDFYEAARDVNKANATLKSMKNLPREEQQAYREEHKKEIQLHGMVNTMQQQLIKLKQREQKIVEDVKMSVETKQAEIKRINAQRDRMSTNVSKLRQKLYD